ncbi:MAG: molybdopterin-dependent oxidoreductase [Actinomycetota bacterium]
MATQRARLGGRVPQLTGRQTNALLAWLLAGLVATGVASWAVGTGWSQVLVSLHAVFGLTLILALPRKATTSVRSGLRRRRPSRWISVAMAGLVVVVLALGFSHSVGVWHGVGEWSALWTHTLLGGVLIPFVLWHAGSRPSPMRRADLDRRMVLGSGVRLAGGAVLVGGLEAGSRLVGSGQRRFTGSREVGSFDPDAMPTVFWINDRVPDLDRDDWPLTIAGQSMTVGQLTPLTRQVEATIDCTGGWYSRQRWDAVALSELFAADELASARSIAIRSATGFHRLFPVADADQTFLAVGYDGRPLRAGHGAPVRIVAPGRRGPWWVKWVTEIELSERPWWAQAPFPTT